MKKKIKALVFLFICNGIISSCVAAKVILIENLFRTSPENYKILYKINKNITISSKTYKKIFALGYQTIEYDTFPHYILPTDANIDDFDENIKVGSKSLIKKATFTLYDEFKPLDDDVFILLGVSFGDITAEVEGHCITIDCDRNNSIIISTTNGIVTNNEFTKEHLLKMGNYKIYPKYLTSSVLQKEEHKTKKSKKKCAHCGQQNSKLKLCSGCDKQKTYYCSRNHQKIDWKFYHRETCESRCE